MTEKLPLIVLKGLEGNEPTHLGPMQSIMSPHADLIIMFWWSVFFITLSIATLRLLKSIRGGGA